MNRYFFSFIISFFLISLQSWATAVPDGTVANPPDSAIISSPHLELDSTYINLGILTPDTIIDRTIIFRNTGSARLSIARIFSDCGCTTSSYTTDPVEPGESGEIHIRYKAGHNPSGFFRKVLRIKSNADNPRQVFVIKGYILSSFSQ